MLLAASLLFYAWGEPRFTGMLVLLCGIDFFLAQLVERGSDRVRRMFFALAIVLNVASLGYFKYSNFFLDEFGRIFSAMGYQSISLARVALPIGISFFIFHKISYVTDVYRKVRPASKDPISFFLYILFFPQLISGPIVRYHEIEDQLHTRPVCLDDIFHGFVRFCHGLAKKILIADVVGHTADQIFKLPASELIPLYAWLGMFAYTAQIYFDFSGYSDMAIGLARIFGFRFPENFDRPYIAQSFTDFWRRWHMSFGRWMREYLYYPLGGSRVSTRRQYLNLWIVFLFSGLWHGAQWTFVLWGIWHGLFMTLERLFLDRYMSVFPVFFRVGCTLLLVALSRILFRADSLSHAVMYYRRLFTQEPGGVFPPLANVTSNHELTMLLIAYFLCLWPLLPVPGRCAGIRAQIREFAQSPMFQGVCAIVLLFLASTAMAGTDFSPFIYFQF